MPAHREIRGVLADFISKNRYICAYIDFIPCQTQFIRTFTGLIRSRLRPWLFNVSFGVTCLRRHRSQIIPLPLLLFPAADEKIPISLTKELTNGGTKNSGMAARRTYEQRSEELLERSSGKPTNGGPTNLGMKF